MKENVILKLCKYGVIGAVVAMTICLLGVTGLSFLVHSEKMELESVSAAAVTIHAIAAAAGALVSVKLAGERWLVQSAVSGGFYILCLLACGIVFFDGAFGNILIELLVVAGSSFLVSLLCGRKKSRFKPMGKKIKKR